MKPVKLPRPTTFQQLLRMSVKSKPPEQSRKKDQKAGQKGR